MKSGHLSWEEHIGHINRFIKWWKEKMDDPLSLQKEYRQGVTQFFQKHLIFQQEKSCFDFPQNFYLDFPQKKTGLTCLFENGSIWSGQRKFLNKKYAKIADFTEFAISLGVMAELPITLTTTKGNPHLHKLKSGFGSNRVTMTCIDKDWTIKDLDKMANAKNEQISRLIWKTLSNASSEVFKAKYRPNQNWDCNEAPSKLIHSLKKYAWIPATDGSFKKPNQMLKEFLVKGFEYNDKNGWLTAIHFGTDSKNKDLQKQERRKYASVLGLDFALVELLSRCSQKEQQNFKQILDEHQKGRPDHSDDSVQVIETPKENTRSHSACPATSIKEAINRTFDKPGKTILQRPELFQSTVSNPERYRQKLREKYRQKQQNEPKQEERFRSKTIQIWESKNQAVRDFLLEEYEGQCQICQQTFPCRDGQPYFEALYLVSYTTAAWVDEPGNVLCLCGQCSAKFQYGAVQFPNFVENISTLATRSEGTRKPAVTIELIGTSVELVFSDRHLLEIQAMLRSIEDLPKLQ